jgi:hypothetical protein
MAAAMTFPTMAAEMSGKVGGRAVADLSSVSYVPAEGDGFSYMDMASQGRIDYTLASTEGDWTFTGKVEIRSNTGTDAYTNPVILQKYFKVENDAVSVALGAQWFGFVYLTPYMGVTDAWDRQCYGCASLRDDRVIVGIKSVGLNILYGVKNQDTTDSTSDAYSRTETGLQYNGTFGAVTVAAQYLTQSFAAIENLDSVTTDSAQDGYAVAQMAFAVRYMIAEGMFAEFDYQTLSTKAKDVDAANTVGMGLAFAMAFSEAQGIAVAWDTWTEDKGTSESADDQVYTRMAATFNQKLAGQQVFAGYQSDTSTVDGEAQGTTTKIAFGGRVDF